MEYGSELWESLGPRDTHKVVPPPFKIISVEFQLHLMGYIYRHSSEVLWVQFWTTVVK